jgi:hypothetical protein
MAKTVTEEERQKAYETLVSLYDKAEPIIKRVSDLNSFNYGELPLNPYMLVEAGITLRMVLDALKKMSLRGDSEMGIIRQEFETALTNCIKAADATEQYVELSGTSRGGVILNTIVTSTVMSKEYIESVARRLADVKDIGTSKTTPHKQPAIKDEAPRREKAKQDKDEPIAKKPGKKRGGFINALDKVGDAIIYPIVKLAELTDIEDKNKKKK